MQLTARVLVATLFFAAGVASCGGSTSTGDPPQDGIVGVWMSTATTSDPKGSGDSGTQDLYIVVNADKTHRLLGRITLVLGKNTTVDSGPCGVGKYRLEGDVLTLDSEVFFDIYNQATGKPEKIARPQSETLKFDLTGGTLTAASGVVYRKAAMPAGLCL